jgi:hypothetical protein
MEKSVGYFSIHFILLRSGKDPWSSLNRGTFVVILYLDITAKAEGEIEKEDQIGFKLYICRRRLNNLVESEIYGIQLSLGPYPAGCMDGHSPMQIRPQKIFYKISYKDYFCSTLIDLIPT